MAVLRPLLQAGNAVLICVTLLVLTTSCGLCNAEHSSSGRTPDDKIELPPKLTTESLDDTQGQLEHWPTKDRLEIPGESEETLKAGNLEATRSLISKGDETVTSGKSSNDPSPHAGKTEAPGVEQIAKFGSASDSPVKPIEPMEDTTADTVPRRKIVADSQQKAVEERNEASVRPDEPTDDRLDSENISSPDARNSSPEQERDDSNKLSSEADSGENEIKTESDTEAGTPTSDDIPVAPAVGSESEEGKGDESQEVEVGEKAKPIDVEEAEIDADGTGTSNQDVSSPDSATQSEESVEEVGRRNYQKTLDKELKKAKKAEDSLIKDAVANGNRAKQFGEDGQSDSVASTEQDKPETALEAEIRELLKQAEQYRSGTKDIKPDYGRAFSFCQSAAEKGSSAGLNCMGEFYKHGLGRERDIDKAVQYFREAAGRGFAAAQRNLAFLYSSGHGVEQSTALAVLHLQFAAVSGDHQAQLAMGYRHMYGIGVPKNCQTAMEFYIPAAEFVVKEMHNNRAQPMIEKQALSTDGVKVKSMDLDEDVVNYYAYSAERGDASAQVALGQLYFMGARGLQQDHGEAFKWYLRAADQGDAHAMGHLGNMYAQGIHVDANNHTALSYFRRGVDKGNALALNGLGFMHMYGMGVPQSYDEAFKSFSKAAEQGNQEARFNLGALHVGGYGVPKDYAKAIYYFTLAANRGHMLALYNLAMMHHNGFGTPRSCPNAVQFIKSVAERGEWAAQLQRGYKLYMAGDVDRSLLTYSETMELGLDVAQANVAHVLDEERSSFTRGQKARALRAYELSAQQGNMAAELKIGDYYYHGWGTAVNYRKAVAHYRAASEARIAQAMFNLGWMHERGTGIARDRHLAKRFYDMAAEAAPEAVWPAGICLARLWLIGAGEALLDTLDAASLALTLRLGKYGVRVPLSSVWLPLAVEYWDAVLGAVLVFWLAVVLAIRSHVVAARYTRN